MAYYRTMDLKTSGSGSSYGGGCFCPKKDGMDGSGAGLSSDLGLLAAGAAAVALLYTAITMAMARRKRRSTADNESADSVWTMAQDLLWQGMNDKYLLKFIDLTL